MRVSLLQHIKRETGMERKPSASLGLSPLRVGANAFLDLPLWLDAAVPDRARTIKELYALAWAGDDGKLSLTAVLLQLCEAVCPRANALTRFSTFYDPLVKAAVLLGARTPPAEPLNPVSYLKPFAIKTGEPRSDSALVSYKALEHVLANGTHLHGLEKAQEVLALVAPQKNVDVALHDVVIASEEVLKQQEHPLLSVCDVYAPLCQSMEHMSL
jgi:hypothetical protein